ncbi:TetR/AcrR family transcriptional regulator [Nocardioides mangrovicus]|nr:TetR/AcrR family transcriptional regulator [Nocardioides mangrovicus]
MTAATTQRTRMPPEQRRELLLEHGVRLLATRSLEELSTELMAEQAGISRGLLYHYFANLQDFHRAVVRKAVEDLVAITAPDDGEDLLGVLERSLAAYVDYVVANRAGYLSLVRAANGGDEELRVVYEQARDALTGRMFERAAGEQRIDGLTALGHADTPATRLMVRGWASLAEELVLAWAEDPSSMTREQLIAALAGSLVGALNAVSG